MSTDVDFAQHYGPWAVIAGGSEGTGEAFAHCLARQGIKLLLVARKQAPLEALAATLCQQYRTEVDTRSVDLTAPDAVQSVAAAANGREVGMFIYNAGADTSFQPFIERTPAETERMIALNIRTPAALTHHFAPPMAHRQRGGIILVSSVASTAGCPGNGVYSASKAFSNILAETLWYELGKHGVRVLGMIIGLARTPAMARLGLNFDGPVKPSEPTDLAEEALAHLERGPTLHAGGTEEVAHRLRSLPRSEAVRAMAGISTDVQ